eukprot:TRINITY_DN13038_c0_g1_i4.p1 TRINITY_DN13038_c0_g1~~TRINITY_DN13038_c0_g1_i4.p1  ORF type:complete len:559 (-),score=51.13 TRINITY_DN13038_c0_g1_i4:168-1844(-)
MQEAVRVNSFGVLVVPPFESAWLTGENCKFKNGQGCLSFQVEGERDCTLKLSSKAGGSRTTVDHGYTIVLGSHRNSKLKIEKNGYTVALIDAFEQCRLVKGRLLSFWVALHEGGIAVGYNQPKLCNQILSYRDEVDGTGAEELYIGLGSWDLHMSYYTVNVTHHLPNDLQQQHLPIGIRKTTVGNSPATTQVQCLEDICAQVVYDNLDLVSALQILKIGGINDRVTNLTILYVSLHFADIFQEQCISEFCQISKEIVKLIYNSQHLCISEFQIYKSLLYWSYGKDLSLQPRSLEKPIRNIEELFSLIRLQLLSTIELKSVENDSLASQHTEISTLLAESKLKSLGKSSNQVVTDKRFVQLEGLNWQQGSRRRIPPDWTVLHFHGFGDGNGVTSYLGTRYFQQTFVNPTICNSMKVTNSGGCQADLKSIVSLNFNEVCFASPDESGDTWWQIDLGPQHLMVCDYYCLRQDSSHNFATHWQLQGSVDSTGWIVLKKHEEDASLANSQGDYVGWEVVSGNAQNPFRYFRLFLTQINQHNFNISNIEFYGFVKKFDTNKNYI